MGYTEAEACLKRPALHIISHRRREKWTISENDPKRKKGYKSNTSSIFLDSSCSLFLQAPEEMLTGAGCTVSRDSQLGRPVAFLFIHTVAEAEKDQAATQNPPLLGKGRSLFSFMGRSLTLSFSTCL